MKLRLRLLCVVAPVALAACALIGSPAGVDRPPGEGWSQRSPDELVNTRWRVEDLGDRGILDRVVLTVQFGPAGRLSGHAGCNSFMGGVQVTQGQLKIGPLASTRKACPEAVMHQEAAFLLSLESGIRLRQRADDLLIDQPAPKAPLRLRREP